MAELTVPQLDFAALGQLPQVYQKAQAQRGLQEALAGGVDTANPQSLAQLAAKVLPYDATTGLSLAQLGNTAQNRQQDMQWRQEEAKRAQSNADRSFGFTQQESQRAQSNTDRNYGLAERSANRQDEDKFIVKEVADPNTGVTSFVKFNPRTGDVAPASGYAPAVSAPNNPFGGGGKFNEGQGKAAGFADRMIQSEAVLSGVAPEGGIGPVAGIQNQGTNWLQRDLNQAPFGISNSLISSDQQKFNQAKEDFINSQLRRESGAAIGKDEFIKADRQYFPQPGDSQEVIAQKAANRRAAIEAMGREGGGSYKPKMSFRQDGALAPYGQPVQSAAAAPADQGQRSNPATFREAPKLGELRDGYRFRGGNPGDPANWAKAQ